MHVPFASKVPFKFEHRLLNQNAYWLTFSIYVPFEVTMNVWNVYMHNKFPNNEFTLTCQMDHIIFMLYEM